MDAVKFLEELKRMCGNTDSCEDCPIFGMKEDNCMTLTFPCFWDEAEIVSAVEKWSAEHPIKTRLMDFLEKFPNAPLYEGLPKTLPSALGYCRIGRIYTCAECKQNGKSLKDCWDLPVEE